VRRAGRRVVGWVLVAGSGCFLVCGLVGVRSLGRLCFLFWVVNVPDFYISLLRIRSPQFHIFVSSRFQHLGLGLLPSPFHFHFHSNRNRFVSRLDELSAPCMDVGVLALARLRSGGLLRVLGWVFGCVGLVLLGLLALCWVLVAGFGLRLCLGLGLVLGFGRWVCCAFGSLVRWLACAFFL
jgi:hypothetical protein